MLGAIFTALTGIPQLIDAGKSIYEAIAGKPSQAATAEDLQAEVAALPAEQQQAFVERMRAAIEQYKAENDRLRNEQGDVDAATLSTLSPEARTRIAEARMTTRPWTVRMFVHFLLTPAYAIWYDGLVVMLQNGLKLVDGIFGTAIAWSPLLLVDQFIARADYREIYTAAVPWLLTGVLGYMTLRSGEKGPAAGNAGGIAGALSSVMGAIGSIRGGLAKR